MNSKQQDLINEIKTVVAMWGESEAFSEEELDQALIKTLTQYHKELKAEVAGEWEDKIISKIKQL